MKSNSFLRKGMVHILSVLMILSTLSFGLAALGFAGPQEVYADSLSTIKAGDTVTMGVESTYYTGTPKWEVLDVIDSDSDGTDDKALLLSEYLWTGDGSYSAEALISFNIYDNNNVWDGSKAKEWCDTFYQKTLKSSDAVLSTDIDDPATANYGACVSNGNRVFFLSESEAKLYFSANDDRIATLPDDTEAQKYWLRSPRTFGNYEMAGSISNVGAVGMTATGTPLAVRPAFYLDLSSDICATKTGTTWTINVNDTSHNEGAANYTWMSENTKCLGVIRCSQCNNVLLSENVNSTTSESPATCVSKAKTIYSAIFTNDKFETQTKEVESGEIDNTAHLWNEEPYWEWTESDNGFTAKAVFTCERSSEHKNSINATVTSSDEAGKTVYTASVDFSGNTFTDTKEVQKPAEKPALIVTADAEEVPAAGGVCSWGIWGYEEDIVDVVSGADFIVQKDTGNGPVDCSGITVTFEEGINDDEGTVSFNAPTNEGETTIKWSLKYDGTVYIHQDENLVESDWPVITQSVKQDEPPADPAVEDALGKINALPATADIAATDKEAIEAARAAYDALTEDQKANFDTDVLKKLTDAEAALKAIEDQAEADAVKAKIDALPAADKVTTADKEKIEAAKAAYDALTEDQKAKIDADTLKKLTDTETALEKAVKAEKDASEKAAAAEARAKKVKTVTVNVATVNAKAINKVVKKKGGSNKYVTKIVFGSKVKKISPKALAKYKKVTTIELKTKKLKKKTVKNSLKGSKVKTVKVKVAKKTKTNKTYVKKYKKIFTKKNAGRKVKVK